MNSVWMFISTIVKSIAYFGAGAMSMGLNYEPKVPNELRNR